MKSATETTKSQKSKATPTVEKSAVIMMDRLLGESTPHDRANCLLMLLTTIQIAKVRVPPPIKDAPRARTGHTQVARRQIELILDDAGTDRASYLSTLLTTVDHKPRVLESALDFVADRLAAISSAHRRH